MCFFPEGAQAAKNRTACFAANAPNCLKKMSQRAFLNRVSYGKQLFRAVFIAAE